MINQTPMGTTWLRSSFNPLIFEEALLEDTILHKSNATQNFHCPLKIHAKVKECK